MDAKTMNVPAFSHRERLFIASCIALIVTAMSFAIRGDILGDLGKQFNLSNEQLGWLAGPAFWGFTLSMIIGGPLCDWLGMGRLLMLAFLGHCLGILLTIFANGFWMLYGGTLAIGMANGMVEAACNPLVATLYLEDKIKKLNHFHVWFPGGIVIGGLVAYALTRAGMNWQMKMATMFIPLAIYGLMFLGQKFPPTERVASGVPTSEMFKECLRPFFLLWLLCMVMTASTELGPNQWIPTILTTTASVSGILVLVWISGLMAIGRQFAGPVVHQLSPFGLLIGSSVFSAVGLLWLSFAKTGAIAFAAATVFAIGVCYFWPTMLGVASERLPKTGALGLAIVGGTGMLASNFALPIMGRINDHFTRAALSAGMTEVQAQAQGGALSLRYVAILPVILIVIFGILFLRSRALGGYKAEKLTGPVVP